MDSAPSGIALLMMPTMVPTNNANRCHAFSDTPAGTGMINQIIRVKATTTAVGSGLGKSSDFACRILRFGQPGERCAEDVPASVPFRESLFAGHCRAGLFVAPIEAKR